MLGIPRVASFAVRIPPRMTLRPASLVPLSKSFSTGPVNEKKGQAAERLGYAAMSRFGAESAKKEGIQLDKTADPMRLQAYRSRIMAAEVSLKMFLSPASAVVAAVSTHSKKIESICATEEGGCRFESFSAKDIAEHGLHISEIYDAKAIVDSSK